MKTLLQLAAIAMLPLAAMSASVGWGWEDPVPAAKPAQQPVRSCFRLSNITIPPDSTHRVGAATPNLYVIIKKNAVQVGDTSTESPGWEADFERIDQNTWPIWEGTDDRYTIEVWNDNGWLYDQLVFKLSDLPGRDFRGVVREKAAQFTDARALATLRFVPVETPDDFQIVPKEMP